MRIMCLKDLMRVKIASYLALTNTDCFQTAFRGTLIRISMHITIWLFITYKAYIIALFCNTLFYIPNPTQFLNILHL